MLQQHRHLAAILFTDIVGYTAMMQRNEVLAVASVKHYTSALKETIVAHSGQVLNDYGDGSLCIFPSTTEALKAAIEIQKQLQTEPVVPLRIGLHSGEIFFEGEKVMGDSINIASRIQSLGQANTVLFSREIFDKIKNQPEFKTISLGKFQFKNVAESMEVFALANEGLVVPDKKKIVGKLQEKKSNRKKILLSATLLFLAIALFFIYRKYSHTAEFTGKEKSVAILPFKFIGDSKDALSDGLVEDILAHLMKIKELKVISYKSSGLYANTKKSTTEIGEELGVSTIMTGTIQQIGNKIKVVPELTDCQTGKIIWTEKFIRDYIQIFDLQTELATQIVNALKTNLTPEEKKELSSRYTENVEAYKLYRKGLYFWNKRTKESFDSAEVYYKRAIDLDPEYALAYSGLADCYSLNNKGLSTAEALPIANAYLAKALALDSNLAEAWTTVGFIQSHYEYDWSGGKRVLEKAIRLSPNYPTAHLYYGNIFIFNGDTQRGIKEVKKALELDPLSNSINWSLGDRYFVTREYDLAITQLKKTVEFDSVSPGAKVWLGLCFLQKKLYTQAIDIFTKLSTRRVPERGLMLSYAYAISGDKLRAKTELNKILQESNDPPHWWMALVHISLGNFDEALTQLEMCYENRIINMVALKISPIYDPIRNEPRFKALLKKLHFE